jgi:uncharacterized protein YjbI with pentapeptide repeats
MAPKLEPQKSLEVWKRLISGRPFWDLQLPTHEGRVDLRGFVAPEPAVERRTPQLGVLGNLAELEIRAAKWKDIDFGRAKLGSLRFHNSQIENCCFEGAKCRDWRIWNTRVANTSFRSADLRDSALGGVASTGEWNTWDHVDFESADMRGTVHQCGEFRSCNFSHAKLAKVDFQGTVFVDCIFAGKLEATIFARNAFGKEGFPPNEMKGVDLRQAQLFDVEFRNLDMKSVTWPEGDEHIVVSDYVATLERMERLFGSRQDGNSRVLASTFAHMRKWAGAHQERGVLSRADVVAAGGEELADEVWRLVGKQ